MRALGVLVGMVLSAPGLGATPAHAGVPELGVEATASPGGRIYSDVWISPPLEDGDYAIAQGNTGALTKDGQALKKGDLLVETVLFANSWPERYWCLPLSIKRGLYGLPKRAVCFSDPGNVGKLTQLRVEGYRLSGSFAVVPYVVKNGYHNDPEGETRTFKREIVYEGIAANALRITYRQLVDPDDEPAPDEPGSFDLAPDGPTILRVKGALIEVHKADDKGITYRVIEGFAPPS